MNYWIIYGILSATFWGVYSIFSKILTSDKYLKIGTETSAIFMLLGIMIVFATYFIIKADLSTNFKVVASLLILIVLTFFLFCITKTGVILTPQIILFGLGQGVLWALGMVFTFLAFKSGAEAAKLVPLYNTNTLIAVLIGIIFLNEVPDEKIKIIAGGSLIVIGGILISN
ncbi:MAG: hypothetical protein PHU32_03915 [Candidatus ainarchaeum sp.]|nr:hypothetical protein [Candidatus ainarchaeum sp.]